MNQPLKFKWHSVYGQILFDRKIKAAWEKVEANRGSGGIDGETIDSYRLRLEENLDSLLAKLRRKEYKPSPVRRHYISKKNGKMRPLGIPNIEDRIVQQSLVDVLQPKFEKDIFHKWSCGYRPNVGSVRVVQVIMANIEQGYNHLFDADIKGFFDNIPHKKLMKILNKYIADGTVLDMVWQWLKAGYMEEGNLHSTRAGTPQGGVISPLLANIYLNELDWTLAEHNIRFVRYADDFLLFAKTEEDIKKAAEVTKAKLMELGLEIAQDKTKFVDFDDDDFDFIGFTFEHWRKRKKDGKPYYIAKPKESSWKDFKSKVKAKTRKTLTFSKDKWVSELNPLIRGKVNHFLVIHQAVMANEEYGFKSACFYKSFGNEMKSIDGYIRQRLRVAMIHHHPSQRKGHAMKTKWNNEFFVKIGLVPSYWYFYSKVHGLTLETYLQQMREKQRKKQARAYQRAKEKGQEYFTPDRERKIKCAHGLATN
ncbi:group II intron reverse transcriptase/maturase [Bacillus infantis]|uniref:group II intron reverse transcriptase/maturase n=1 Tax=Bacillus infantis TaxID=324767 RepID=UPI003CF4AFD8